MDCQQTINSKYKFKKKIILIVETFRLNNIAVDYFRL